LGESGCGKSTLLAMAAGLLIPDSGQVLCDGQEVKGPDRHRMLMFQVDALFPWLDVIGNVLYGLKFVPDLNRSQKEERAKEFLNMVGLADFRRFRIHELSGGMRQRAALARALAPDPYILLMDEPFSALDAMTREQLYADLQRIWQETGKTIVMVTHNVREAVCLSCRVVLLASPGRVVGEEKVNLPYPRHMNDVDLAATAGLIHSRLSGSKEESC
jgi:NitT/TauT family transport system ATP-binding protein